MAKRKPYKDVAERVLAAVQELNAALVEAHEHPQVRVHMQYPENPIRPPMRYGCEVTRITKHAVAAEDDGTKMFQWRAMIVEKPAKKGRKTKKSAKKPKARMAA